MIEQPARVIAADADWVEIEAQRQTGCSGCSAQTGCGVSLLDRVLGRRPLRLRLPNAINAQPGDKVLLGIADDELLKAAVIAYLLPLLGLLVGAMIGAWLFPRLGLGSNELWSLAGGVLGFTLVLAWVAQHGRSRRYSTHRLRHDC